MKRLLRATAWLLAAVLLLGGCRIVSAPQTTDTPLPTAIVTSLWEGIPLYGDAVEAELCGDVLQVSTWQNSSDTASGGIFLFDLANGTQTGQLALTADAWSVGALEDGVYTVSLTSGQVTLYNTACKRRLSWNLSTGFAFAEVSRDGEWLLYADTADGTVRLRRLKTGEEREILSFSGHIESAGVRDGAFYITCGAEELLRVDPQKEYAEALVVDDRLHRFTPYYCVGVAEDGWYAVSADRPAEAITLPAAGQNEELLAAGKSGWLTAETADTTTVRLYRPYVKDTVSAAVTGQIRYALCTTDGVLLVTADGDTAAISRLLPQDGVLPPDTSTRSGIRFLLEEVPVIPQNPAYPTGCESVSAVMALRYAGEDVTVDEFIDNCLPTDDSAFTKEDGRYYGPDPYEVFVGDPRTDSSYGCMAPVIERAIDTYFGTDTRTVNTTGMSLERLCEQYVAVGTPVLTWVTIAMREVEYRSTWYTPDGKQFTWPGNEHCMVLVGYDAEKYYFNDPYLGMRIAYDRTLAENRYYTLGCQSLAIV